MSTSEIIHMESIRQHFGLFQVMHLRNSIHRDKSCLLVLRLAFLAPRRSFILTVLLLLVTFFLGLVYGPRVMLGRRVNRVKNLQLKCKRPSLQA